VPIASAQPSSPLPRMHAEGLEDGPGIHRTTLEPLGPFSTPTEVASGNNVERQRFDGGETTPEAHVGSKYTLPAATSPLEVASPQPTETQREEPHGSVVNTIEKHDLGVAPTARQGVAAETDDLDRPPIQLAAGRSVLSPVSRTTAPPPHLVKPVTRARDALLSRTAPIGGGRARGAHGFVAARSGTLRPRAVLSHPTLAVSEPLIGLHQHWEYPGDREGAAQPWALRKSTVESGSVWADQVDPTPDASETSRRQELQDGAAGSHNPETRPPALQRSELAADAEVDLGPAQAMRTAREHHVAGSLPFTAATQPELAQQAAIDIPMRTESTGTQDSQQAMQEVSPQLRHESSPPEAMRRDGVHPAADSLPWGVPVQTTLAHQRGTAARLPLEAVSLDSSNTPKPGAVPQSLRRTSDARARALTILQRTQDVIVVPREAWTTGGMGITAVSRSLWCGEGEWRAPTGLRHPWANRQTITQRLRVAPMVRRGFGLSLSRPDGRSDLGTVDFSSPNARSPQPKMPLVLHARRESAAYPPAGERSRSAAPPHAGLVQTQSSRTLLEYPPLASPPSTPAATGAAQIDLPRGSAGDSLDFDELIDTVWRKLLHKVAVEQERRGLTRWP